MESGLAITHPYFLVYEAQELFSPSPFSLADIGLFLQYIKGVGYDVVIMFRHAACFFHHLIVFSQRRTISQKSYRVGLYVEEGQPALSCPERSA